MRFRYRLLSAALACAALPAAAETGFRYGVGSTQNTTIDVRLTEGYGQFFAEIGTDFGIQGDLTAFRYDFDTELRANFALHLSYAVSDEAQVGIYAGRQDWFGADYNYYGIEYGFQHPALRGDMHIGKFTAANGGFDRVLYGTDLSFPISSQSAWSAQAGLHGTANGFSEQLVYVGAGYEFTEGLKLSARFSRVVKANQSQFGMFLERETGKKVPFSRRGWSAAFKAF